MRIICTRTVAGSQRRPLRGLTITLVSLIGYSVMARDCRRGGKTAIRYGYFVPLRNRSDGCYRGGADCAGSGRS